jgi:ABC-type antimicrobial peptide transport system permease subunit
MKKMPTITSLALGSIRMRTRQYATLVTGIILAIFFTSSMLLIGQSIYHTYQERYFRQVGKQDAVMLDAEDVSPETFLKEVYVQNVGNIFIIGVTEGGETPIAYYDEVGEALAYKQCVNGRMPEAVGEIAVERSKLQRLRSDVPLGGTLTLSVKVPDGSGFLPVTVTKSYTLVGILSEQTAYQKGGWRFSENYYLGYPGAVVFRGEQVEPGGRPIVHRLLQFSPLHINTASTEFRGNGKYQCWIDYYGFQLFAGSDSNSSMMATMVFMLGIVLVGVACMGIAGSFSMMLSERRAQIGMFRAVGATRRQIRRIFGWEALIISLTVAPAAIALSHLAVWGLSKALGGGFIYFAATWFLPLELCLSIAFVMGAAFIPLLKASHISPMQAIRETSLLRAKKRMRIRLKQTFWPPSLLALRHLKLYRAKQVGVSAVVALSFIVLTMGFNAAWNILSSRPGNGYDFMISSTMGLGGFVEENALRPQLTQSDLTEAAALPLVGTIQASKSIMVNLLLKSVSEYLTGDADAAFEFRYLEDETQSGGDLEPWLELDRKRYQALKTRQNIDAEMVSEQMSALSPELIGLLKPYVLSGEIDIQALSDGREVLIIAPDKMYVQFDKDANGDISGGSSGSKPEKGKRYDKVLVNDMFHPGDTLTLCRLYMEGGDTGREDEDGYDYAAIRREDKTVRIGAVLCDELPLDVASHIHSSYRGALITTIAGLDAMGFETSGYKSLSVKLTDVPDEQTETYLETALSGIANRAESMDFYSSFTSTRDSLQWQTMMIVSDLSVLILFFAISVSMVNNAVTGRIRSDKQAIGTLRAVGAPLYVIISSYLRQVAIMLGWGLVAGVLLSAGFLAYEAHEGILPKGMVLPLAGVMVLYILLILLFCGFNLSGRIRGIVRSSIIDNIREL